MARVWEDTPLEASQTLSSTFLDERRVHDDTAQAILSRKEAGQSAVTILRSSFNSNCTSSISRYTGP